MYVCVCMYVVSPPVRPTLGGAQGAAILGMLRRKQRTVSAAPQDAQENGAVRVLEASRRHPGAAVEGRGPAVRGAKNEHLAPVFEPTNLT